MWINLAVHLQLLKGYKYSKFPSIWLTWHPTGAKLSNILDYQLEPTFMGNFLLLIIHLGCTIKHRSIPLGYLISICWFWVLFSVFPSLHSWRCGGKKRSGDKHIWYTDTLGGLFENGPKICLFYLCSFYLVNSKQSDLGTTFLKYHIIRSSKLLVRAQEFCCISYLDIQDACTIIVEWTADVPLKPMPHFRIPLWENC
jgi:hypothetical protein